MKLKPYLIKNILKVVLENEQVVSMPPYMSKMTSKFQNLKSTFFGKSPSKCNIFGINSGAGPQGGLQGNSHNALGRCDKASKRFSKGKPEAVCQRFA